MPATGARLVTALRREEGGVGVRMVIGVLVISVACQRVQWGDELTTETRTRGPGGCWLRWRERASARRGARKERRERVREPQAGSVCGSRQGGAKGTRLLLIWFRVCLTDRDDRQLLACSSLACCSTCTVHVAAWEDGLTGGLLGACMHHGPARAWVGEGRSFAGATI